MGCSIKAFVVCDKVPSPDWGRVGYDDSVKNIQYNRRFHSWLAKTLESVAPSAPFFFKKVYFINSDYGICIKRSFQYLEVGGTF